MTEQWQELKETITEMRDNGGTGTQQEVCKFLANYMEILEKQMQQPCEDCISREQAKDAMYALCDETETFEDNPWRDNPHIDAIIDGLDDLPSVTPKAKIGKWNFIGYCMFECSSCGTPYTQEQLAYMRKYSYEEFPKHCPNCGARMTESEE